MPQFLIAPEDAVKKSFRLSGPDAFHVVKVLRRAAGQVLELFDGKGGRFTGIIETIEDDGTVLGRLTETITPTGTMSGARIHLHLGLLKSAHWDYAVEKATELGVASIVPTLTPRTVVLLKEVDRTAAKRERWARLAMAAAKQCGRADLPEIGEPVQFRDAIRSAKDKGLILLAWEGRRGDSAKKALHGALTNVVKGDVRLFVGPEGGFSDEEVELAEADGAVVFGMGSRILRAETAAIAALALIQYELGGL